MDDAHHLEPVRRHAERVLFTTSLTEKLAPWPALDVADDQPAVRGVDLPGRPAELAFATGHRPVPGVRGSDVATDAGRVRVLHELLNHELQALELMALALLRWPDAPAGLRRGLVRALGDEQRHLGLYRDRLVALGGEVGAWPVSRFFWDTLAGVSSMPTFIAGMSLCFETANLDFARIWRGRFDEAEDPETAAILAAVHDDEVRHVALGLGWFRRWSDDGDVLAAWQRALPPTLSPSRSRGPTFDAEARARAGFTASELDVLRIVGGSRGRPPRVVWFDAGVEEVVANGGRSARSTAISRDLGSLAMFVVGAEDVVVADPPDPAFLVRLADAGFEIPRFVADPAAASLGPFPVAAFDGWGPCPKPRFAASGVTELAPVPPWRPGWAALSSKTATAAEAQVFAGHPAVVEDLGAVWRDVGDPGPRWLIKAPFSTSGTERIAGDGPFTDAHRAWLDTRLRRWGEVLWQPRYDVVADVSVHVTVDDAVRVDGITRFATRSGVYAGAWLGRWTRGLPADVERAAHGDGDAARAMGPVLERAGVTAGSWAQRLGFRGPLSIDAAVVRTDDGYRLHPWLETNARRTLGRVALGLTTRIHPRSSAWWRVERRTDAAVASLVAATQARPVVLGDERLVSGVLPTTDPTRATALLTWLDVEPAARGSLHPHRAGSTVGAG